MRVQERAPRREGILVDPRAAELCCASGPCKNSGIASARLGRLGYTNVRDYHEGEAEWIEAGLPVEGEARAAV